MTLNALIGTNLPPQKENLWRSCSFESGNSATRIHKTEKMLQPGACATLHKELRHAVWCVPNDNLQVDAFICFTRSGFKLL